jgi:alcohol dehydrogenase YqhD (iron-dependent ADH family)
LVLHGCSDIPEEQIKELAEKCNAAVRGNLGKVKHLDVEDMIAIYTAAK